MPKTSCSKPDSQSLMTPAGCTSFSTAGLLMLQQPHPDALLGESCSAVTDLTRYTRSRARLAATLKRWSWAFPESAWQRSGSATIESNMMSRSWLGGVSQQGASVPFSHSIII